MKLKIKVLIVFFVIAIFSIVGITISQDDAYKEVKLEVITLSARADGESSNNRGPMCYDSKWRAGCKLIEGYCSPAAVANCDN